MSCRVGLSSISFLAVLLCKWHVSPAMKVWLKWILGTNMRSTVSMSFCVHVYVRCGSRTAYLKPPGRASRATRRRRRPLLGRGISSSEGTCDTTVCDLDMAVVVTVIVAVEFRYKPADLHCHDCESYRTCVNCVVLKCMTGTPT